MIEKCLFLICFCFYMGKLETIQAYPLRNDRDNYDQSCFWTTETAQIYPLPTSRASEFQRYIFRTIEAIDSDPVSVSGDIAKLDLSQEELDGCVDLAFRERGLNPIVSLDDYDHYPDPAVLQINIGCQWKSRTSRGRISWRSLPIKKPCLSSRSNMERKSNY